MNLTVNGLSFHYPGNEVLKDVTFSVEKGDRVAILGTNGVGKSTLLKCLNRILKRDGGSVLVDGADVNAMSRERLARKIGYVSQSCRFSETTVYDAVLLGRKPYIKWEVSEKDLLMVQNILKQLSMEAYALRPVTELSGGEMQKVSIARALAQEPQVLLFDEPTSSLDLKNQIEVINLIQKIVKEKHISAVATMHDLNLAARFANKFLMVADGRIYASGGPEILTEENIHAVYGVRTSVEMRNGMPLIIPL
ncbi:ABC transporter ATP-binding protein [Qiania dongpingensis]|uniref:ABC transporter ATP-binding protein n=1 Tax=Qiania dongpingensis TaxID=2763669 RepID=A0A7G9G2M3_9FIRM|nr:ABC transporter ATP-binding protein [Qiania dongpingensis]QNM05055.1 ABC transporter ATP-binding protein [Qiania dongpingensis]